MINSDILIKLNPIISKLNPRQKKIAMDILYDNQYIFAEYQGSICIKTKDGLYNFLDFVKSKCNCG